MKTILGITIFLIVLVLSPMVCFAELDIKINIKDSFSLNEKIYFDYTIFSDEGYLLRYIEQIICPKAPSIPPEIKELNLTKDMIYEGTYNYLTVLDYIEPQTCTAYIRVMRPLEQKVSKNFTIATSPSFDFEIKTCKDVNCQEKAKVFSQGQNIYLSYDSSVANPTITATLTYPNKTTQTINIPSSIKVSQIGTYNLEVTASKPGYKTITKKLQFGVIEEEVVIPTEKVTPSEKAPAEEKVPPAKEPTERPPEVEAKIKELKAKILEIQQKIVQLLILLIQLLQQKL